MKFENNEKVSFFKRKSLYFALAVCMLALGAGAWSAVNPTPSDKPDDIIYSTTQTPTVKDVEKNQPGVTAAPTTQSTTAKATVALKTTAKKISEVADFFVMPLGGKITKNFSDTQVQYSETYKDWRIHLGVDIAAEKGTQVRAAGNGKVTDVTEDPLMGNTVTIDHGNGIIAYYSGLNKPTVKKGQVIEVGTVIGGVDTIPCETVESHHIHLAVKHNGKWADPIAVMKIEIS
ncbi:MAG: M23 family metallopeptidase [Clostridia bacterium]|nr:M23 family metallopeptidase [Clostridia bacterium]